LPAIYKFFCSILCVMILVLFFNGCSVSDGVGNSVTITIEGEPQQEWTDGITASFYESPHGTIPADVTAITTNSVDFPSIIIYFDGQAAASYDITAVLSFVCYIDGGGQIYLAITGLGDCSGTINVTSYGAVGERIEGTFDIMIDKFLGADPSGNLVNATGSFSVRREANTP
jgi:hypothetical protein